MKKRSMMLVMLVGCGDMSMMSSDVGVTAGGSQDITLARDLIEDGQIPDQEHYTAEGLFSEHDLPLSGAVCDQVLCPRAAATIYRPADGSEAQALIQLGFGSSITADTFERPDLDVAAVVDVSGSMEGSMGLVRSAMLDMVGQLDKDDHMSLVIFGSRAKVLLDRTQMNADGREKMRDEIRKLDTEGSTDMESGMSEGYAQLKPSSDQSHRLMVFTDAQPNTGVTEKSDFLKMVRSQSARGVGTTLYGVGYDLGSELADALSKVEGGSYHFLTGETLDRLFIEEFDFAVSPVAYDLTVSMSPCDEAELDEVYGAPTDGRGVSMGASTLFLSSRSGGIGATLSYLPEGPEELGTLELSYRPVTSDEYITEQVTVQWEGGSFIEEADDEGVYKMSGLIDEYRALLAASEFCDGDQSQDEALAIIAATSAQISHISDQLTDAPLAAEAALMDVLTENVRAGQDRCAPADTYLY